MKGKFKNRVCSKSSNVSVALKCRFREFIELGVAELFKTIY
jgi:hypothetical protein